MKSGTINENIKSELHYIEKMKGPKLEGFFRIVNVKNTNFSLLQLFIDSFFQDNLSTRLENIKISRL